MKRLLIACAFVCVAAPALAQPVIQAGQGFGFDYRASDITTASVVRFELPDRRWGVDKRPDASGSDGGRDVGGA